MATNIMDVATLPQEIESLLNVTIPPTSSTNGLTVIKGCYLFWADVLSLTALIGYGAIFWTIMKYKKTHFKNSFYTLILSMAVCDMTLLLYNLVYLTPAVLVGDKNMPNWYAMMAGFVYVWAFYNSTTHMVAISFNRLAAITLMQNYQTYFTTTKLALIIGSSYVFSLITATIVYIWDCPLRVPSVTVQHICSDGRGLIPMTYVQMECLVKFIIPVVVYIAIIIFMRKQYRQSDNQAHRRQIKKEKILVSQFGLVVFTYMLFVGVFWLEFFLDNEFTRSDGQILLGTLSILHSGLDPFLYMTFGSEVKRLMLGNAVAPATSYATSIPHRQTV